MTTLTPGGLWIRGVLLLLIVRFAVTSPVL